MTRTAPYLALSVLAHFFNTAAALPLSLPSSVAPDTPSLSLTKPLSDGTNAWKQFFTTFPPGPPPTDFYYAIPGSELTLELSALGMIRGRDESVVEKVLKEAFRASLDPFRPQVAVSGDGYKLQKGSFLLGVIPSRQLPGEKLLTWGMWTEALAGIYGYVEAYPGYDFAFKIWLMPQVEHSKGYVVGTGFAKTRGK